MINSPARFPEDVAWAVEMALMEIAPSPSKLWAYLGETAGRRVTVEA
jgi:hypothetical protein